MHAFLITGNDPEKLDNVAQTILKKEGGSLMEFSVEKIADIRELQKFTKLKVTQKTAILIKNFDQSTEEAQNAFLKNLEEPQDNLIYILTAYSPDSVLLTIASRCQIIETPDFNRDLSDEDRKKILSFLGGSVGDKLTFTSKIKDREEAVNFLTNVMLASHKLLENNSAAVVATEAAMTAKKAIEANGNVQLQLTNFVVKLSLS